MKRIERPVHTETSEIIVKGLTSHGKKDRSLLDRIRDYLKQKDEDIEDRDILLEAQKKELENANGIARGLQNGYELRGRKIIELETLIQEKEKKAFEAAREVKFMQEDPGDSMYEGFGLVYEAEVYKYPTYQDYLKQKA
jgi:hypothetical protein